MIDTIWAADLYGIYKVSRRRAVVNPIQIEREYCIVLNFELFEFSKMVDLDSLNLLL